MDVQLVENNEFLGKDIEDGYAKINGSEEKKIPINVSEEKESKKYFNINATIFIEIITVYFLRVASPFLYILTIYILISYIVLKGI